MILEFVVEHWVAISAFLWAYFAGGLFTAVLADYAVRHYEKGRQDLPMFLIIVCGWPWFWISEAGPEPTQGPD